MNKKWILNSILILLIIIVLGCGSYLFIYFWNAGQSEEEIRELQKWKTEAFSEPKEQEILSDKPAILKEYQKLYQKNHDLCGWLIIKGTKIDYPVMQTPDEPEFYLHRNYKKQKDSNGLPFLDAVCNLHKGKNNLIIYGHHMKSGFMFTDLLNYQKKEFYENHKVIEFDTLYEKQQYEIVAVFRTRIYHDGENGFKYYDYCGDLTRKRYESYVDQSIRASLYKTGVKPVYGEQLLTLVTCAYHEDEGRFVVVARKKGTKVK